MFDQVVKSFLRSEARLRLTERPEKKHSPATLAGIIGSKEIPGGKGTGGPMPRIGEDARPEPMVQGAAVSEHGAKKFLSKNFQNRGLSAPSPVPGSPPRIFVNRKIRQASGR